MVSHNIYPIARIVVAKDPLLAQKKAAPRPSNVVLILADDLGIDFIGTHVIPTVTALPAALPQFSSPPFSLEALRKTAWPWLESGAVKPVIHQVFPAAEAARCASAQGVFWEYHDLLYVAVPEFSRDDLVRYHGIGEERIAVARGTVETAYQLLAGEGYVVRRGAAGTLRSASPWRERLRSHSWRGPVE